MNCRTYVRIIAIFFFCFSPILFSCGKERPDTVETYDIQDTLDVIDQAEWLNYWPPSEIRDRVYTGKEVAKRRALQMASIRWTPQQGNIPSRYGLYLDDVTYTGLPYSLAIKTDSHIGTQVSLYTFMTAVDNPSSVLYTEDLREAPYYGFDCAPYYGTTCSNSVLFALGIEAPFYTYMIRSIPGIVKPKGQNPEDVEECDILLKTGHVVMVYEVERDAEENLTAVKLFETTSANQKDTWIRSLSADEFREYWESRGIVRLQYSLIDLNTDYEPCLFIPLDDEPTLSNYCRLPLCTTRGDRASFLEGDDVEISILSGNYRWIQLVKGDEVVETREIKMPSVRFSNLTYGSYKAYLIGSDKKRNQLYTSFEIIDAKVSADNRDKLCFVFSSKNASARYACVCDDNHNPYSYYPFSDSDRESGRYETYAATGNRSTNYKVYFRGEYGVVSTELKCFN